MNLKYSGSYFLGDKRIAINLWQLSEDSHHLMTGHPDCVFMVKHPCWIKYFNNINEARDFLFYSVNNKGAK